jgi:hypothetical protein
MAIAGHSFGGMTTLFAASQLLTPGSSQIKTSSTFLPNAREILNAKGSAGSYLPFSHGHDSLSGDANFRRQLRLRPVQFRSAYPHAILHR